MKQFYKLTLLLSLCLISFFCYSQKKFAINIAFPKNINLKETNVLYDNGTGLQKANYKIKNNQIMIIDNLVSRYAIITFIYKEEELIFYSSDKTSKVQLSTRNEHLVIENSVNVSFPDSIEKERMSNHFMSEKNNLTSFLETNKNWQSSDSLVKIFWKKKFDIENKKLEFVKQNSNLYYSFSIFRRELIHSHINIDTLLNTFHQCFPDNFKFSTEGSEILKVLNGRNLKKNLKAPDFNLLDIKGKKVALQNLKNNYVLLTFWSTSCKPCLEEMPTILQLNNSYAQKKLTVISVSTDTEREIFLKTIKKYQMNWINIYGNLGDIIKSYGVKSIPQIYLIDKSGKIIYSREEEEDFTPELLILRTTLKNIFLNT